MLAVPFTIFPPPVVLFVSVMGPMLYIRPREIIGDPPSLVTFPPELAVEEVILLAAVVVTVGKVIMLMVLVPCAATEPQVVGVPEKVRLAAVNALAVMVCPAVAPLATSAVTQKYPMLLVLIDCEREVKLIGLVVSPVVTVLNKVGDVKLFVAV